MQMIEFLIMCLLAFGVAIIAYYVVKDIINMFRFFWYLSKGDNMKKKK